MSIEARGLRPNREQRWNIIQSMLERKPVVLISELAATFGVSTETARRDIDAMADAELVERTYGGATALRTGREPAFSQRASLLMEERKRMAAAAASRVRDNDVLMIDSSATCVHLAERLALERHNLQAITNSFAVASALAYNSTFRIIMASGFYQGTEGANYGSETTEFLRRFHADLCFSSCGALAPEGPTEVDSDVAAVKRVMFSQSRRVLLLADHSKFRRHRLELVGPLTDIDELITDQRPPASLQTALESASVRVLVASAP
jgi:DeoR/GlpR family transcriptional regulator of sugar metabolism